MYYVTNFVSCFFTIIAIAIVYEKTAPSWLILVLLLTAGCFQFIASALLVAKYDKLEERIKKLESKKENK